VCGNSQTKGSKHLRTFIYVPPFRKEQPVIITNHDKNKYYLKIVENCRKLKKYCGNSRKLSEIIEN